MEWVQGLTELVKSQKLCFNGPSRAPCSQHVVIVNATGPAKEMGSDSMGFKPSVTVAQTTRFKRKQSSTRTTPPATPFNNTSFLIQLQQLRELQHCGSSQTLQFDQYGSMESTIACCSSSSLASPASPQNHTALGRSLSIMPKEWSPNANCSNHGENSSDPDERTCGMRVQQCPSCSDGQSFVTKLKLETDPEMHEGDGMFTNRHLQHFMDNFVEVLASEPRECPSK